MAAFNDNLQCIGSETKALQAVHLTAKGKLREEEQKVEALKAEIAEHTTNRDVSLLLTFNCMRYADQHYPQSAQSGTPNLATCGSLESGHPLL